LIVDKIIAHLNKENRPIDEALLTSFTIASRELGEKLLFTEKRDSKGKIYMSHSGRCSRQSSYAYLGYEVNGRVIDARSKFNFFMGDVVELGVMFLAKAAGCDVKDFGVNQKKVVFKIHNQEITGRPDGVLNGDTLVEVKSFNTYGFREFEKGKVSDDYMAQGQAYLLALGLEKGVFVGVCKDIGVLHEIPFELDTDIVWSNRVNYIQIIKSKEQIPHRPDWAVPNDKGFYPWQCLYCSFYKTCLPHTKLHLVGNAYKLKVVKDETRLQNNP